MERTQRGEKVRAVLRYLVTAIGRPTNFKTMMARSRLQPLGHDPPPSPLPPSPRPLRNADGGWRCRGLCVSPCSSASLRLMPFPKTTRPPPLPVESICRPSEQHFATLRISFQRRHILLQMHQPVLLLPP